MILVTGGAGYIGSHAVRALADKGYEPLIFDDLSTGHRAFAGAFPLVEGDLRDAGAVRRVFAEYPVEGVIHFASRALVGESSTDPALYYENNVVGGLNLLNAMKDAGVMALIFSSSCATYGIPQTEDIGEDHPQNPINPYGETKLALERAIEWFHRAYGLRFLALRYFNAAGADPEGVSGESHDPETHLVPLVLDAAAGIRTEVSIYGTDYATPDGTCIRDYVHVVDLADAHVEGLGRILDGSLESQALNLGTGRGASVREIIDVCRRLSGSEFRVVEAPRRVGDPPRLVASIAKARAELGWAPCHSSLDEIVSTAWNWRLRSSGLNQMPPRSRG